MQEIGLTMAPVGLGAWLTPQVRIKHRFEHGENRG